MSNQLLQRLKTIRKTGGRKMITRNIGKNTLGDNNKMKVHLKTYNRSTHNLSTIFRNTQSVGTLVPFISIPMCKDDTFKIKLTPNVLTHPTVGPLFGSFKLQNDMFFCPIRLYNSWLHNNKNKIGLNMSQIKLPKITLTAYSQYATDTKIDNPLMPSSLLTYLGISNVGQVNGSDPFTERNFNAVPLLAYYDIFKNYYANKQEDNFYIRNFKNIVTKVTGLSKLENGQQSELWNELTGDKFTTIRSMSVDTYLMITVDEDIPKARFEANCEIYCAFRNERGASNLYTFKWIPLTTYADHVGYNEVTKSYKYKITRVNSGRTSINIMGVRVQIGRNTAQVLDDLDTIREDILATPGNRNWIFQNREGQDDEIPFMNFLMNQKSNNKNGGGFLFSPEWGLVTKTYQSDLCQNWINTEWLDGDDGINQITAVAVEDGKFTIDALNLANKVYNYLNRIAVSDGSYRSWLETTWTGSYTERTETPIYCGGSSAEIIFQEVISTSAATDEPLGTLAGRGMDSNHKGGYITVRATEPGYLIGITSITPRLDYTQGNQWDVNLDSIDDLHKPALDGIGFQDLSAELLHGGTTQINTINDTVSQKFIGKQPAWIDYMTNINRAYGNFRTNENFMILSRQYELDYNTKNIKDLTTYIDPELYNGIFADQSFDAQNFWVQIGVEIEARRLMSAKIIPNL